MVFVKGDKRINREGLNRMTEEEKIERKIKKEVIEDKKAKFVKKMESSLDTSAETLEKEAKKGNIVACKEINNRALGMSKLAIEHSGEIKREVELNESQFKQLIGETKKKLDSKEVSERETD